MPDLNQMMLQSLKNHLVLLSVAEVHVSKNQAHLGATVALRKKQTLEMIKEFEKFCETGLDF